MNTRWLLLPLLAATACTDGTKEEDPELVAPGRTCGSFTELVQEPGPIRYIVSSVSGSAGADLSCIPAVLRNQFAGSNGGNQDLPNISLTFTSADPQVTMDIGSISDTASFANACLAAPPDGAIDTDLPFIAELDAAVGFRFAISPLPAIDLTWYFAGDRTLADDGTITAPSTLSAFAWCGGLEDRAGYPLSDTPLLTATFTRATTP